MVQNFRVEPAVQDSSGPETQARIMLARAQTRLKRSLQTRRLFGPAHAANREEDRLGAAND